jgi:hypothetical protein
MDNLSPNAIQELATLMCTHMPLRDVHTRAVLVSAVCAFALTNT